MPVAEMREIHLGLVRSEVPLRQAGRKPRGSRKSEKDAACTQRRESYQLVAGKCRARGVREIT